MGPDDVKKMGITFDELIEGYKKMQDKLLVEVKNLASAGDSANAGAFILLQFKMAQVTQVGESISNMIGQVNKVIGNAISQQKTQ